MAKCWMACINNSGYDVSLERGKLYCKIEDLEAEKDGLIRVIDESGKNYCYPESFFIDVGDCIEKIEIQIQRLIDVLEKISQGIRYITDTSGDSSLSYNRNWKDHLTQIDNMLMFIMKDIKK